MYRGMKMLILMEKGSCMKKKKLLNWTFGFLLVTGGVTSQNCMAVDLTECMSEKVQQAAASMTIGDLRLECEKELQAGTFKAVEKEEAVVSERMRQDKEHILQPFTLMAHKPNYILLGAHNFYGYESDAYQEVHGEGSIEAEDTEAQFQISMKVPLAVNLFDTVDLYGAYTNRSFWQLYNSSSAPFRETNHEPEGWVQFNPKWEFWGFTNTSNMIGIVHQSNGRGTTLSRSWNRVYANFIVEKGNLALSFKPWFRISEDDEDDDNSDITDFLGHSELRVAYKLKEHVFSVMSRNNIESGFENGAVELSWSFPIFGYPYFKGYVQYFTGYGESLIDYDNYVNRIGVGIAVTDWL
ncbi:MAG: phospholipase A1 [Desulforhopalus sp.]|jgi:phospholipase A1